MERAAKRSKGRAAPAVVTGAPADEAREASVSHRASRQVTKAHRSGDPKAREYVFVSGQLVVPGLAATKLFRGRRVPAAPDRLAEEEARLLEAIDQALAGFPERVAEQRLRLHNLLQGLGASGPARRPLSST